MKDHPKQLYMFSIVEVTPAGDGRYVVRPTTPQQWLTCREAAKALGMSKDAIQDWARKGLVKARRCGVRKYQVEAQSLYDFAGKPYNHLQ